MKQSCMLRIASSWPSLRSRSEKKRQVANGQVPHLRLFDLAEQPSAGSAAAWDAVGQQEVDVFLL